MFTKLFESLARLPHLTELQLKSVVLSLTGVDQQQQRVKLLQQQFPNIYSLDLCCFSLVKENEDDGAAQIGDSFFQLVSNSFGNLRKLNLGAFYMSWAPRVRTP